jgi:hypothetical protein
MTHGRQSCQGQAVRISPNFSRWSMLLQLTIRLPNRCNKRQVIDSDTIFFGYACAGIAENRRISTTYCHGMVVATPLTQYQIRMAPLIEGWRKNSC